MFGDEIGAALEGFVGPDHVMGDDDLQIFATWFHNDRELAGGGTRSTTPPGLLEPCDEPELPRCDGARHVRDQPGQRRSLALGNMRPQRQELGGEDGVAKPGGERVVSTPVKPSPARLSASPGSDLPHASTYWRKGRSSSAPAPLAGSTTGPAGSSIPVRSTSRQSASAKILGV